MTMMRFALLRSGLALACAGFLGTALAAGPAPEATTATNPLGGKAPVGAKAPAGQAREISWAELVPKDWDPMKAYKDIDFSKLDDADPKAAELLLRMQEASDNAPANPELNGAMVRIPGFIVPLEEAKGEVTEFLLVPYFGACIHTPPPPANQILHIRPAQGAKFRAMDTVWVTGKLQVTRNESMMGVSGYSMTAQTVTKYTGGAK